MVDVNGGWVKLYRSVRHNWLWENGNERYAKWWMDILMMVNHEPRKVLVNGKLVTIGAGQRLTSIRKLANQWNVSPNTILKFLDLLVSDGMISLNKSRTDGTTLKVLNYADYQVIKDEKNKQSDTPSDTRSDTGSDTHHDTRSEYKQELKNSKEPKNISSSSSGDSSPFEFWENNGFGLLSPKTRTDLQYWVKDLQEIGANESNARRMLIKAMGVAIDNGAFNYGYVSGILRNWESKRFKSPEEVDAYESRRKAETRDVPGTNQGRARRSEERRSSEPYGGIKF